MKRTRTFIWLLTATIVAFSLVDIGFAFQNEPEGFRGLKWGDPPTEDMRFVFEDGRGGDVYMLPGEKRDYLFEAGDVSFSSILYGFLPQQKKFAGIRMYFEGRENYSRLKRICRGRFDKATTEKSYDLTWLGTTSLVGLSYDPLKEEGTLIFASRILLEDWLQVTIVPEKELEVERAEGARVTSETRSIFWMSITEGLLILRHWQVWMAVILYMAINLAFLMIIGIATIGKGGQSGGRMAMGCLFHMVGGTVLHALLMGSMVAFLLPIILLGGTSAAPISAIIGLLWPIVRASVIAIVVVTILTFIPLIGQLVADSPGIQAFLEGVIIFRFLSGDAIDQMLTEVGVQGIVYPGLWESIAFLIVAGVLVRALMFVMALLSVSFKGTAAEEWMTIVVGPVLGVLGGLIALFMYSSYARLSIAQLVGGI